MINIKRIINTNEYHLEEPSITRKDEIINYLEELRKYKSDDNGIGPLSFIYEGYQVEEAINICLKAKDNNYAKTINRVPSKTYLLIRNKDNKIIGATNIRLKIYKKYKWLTSHIGYNIRPTERKKGYSRIILYLSLLESKRLGLTKIKIITEPNNIPSIKTIESLKGILKKKAIDPYDNSLTNVYIIDVNKSIKSLYEEAI